MTEKERRTGTAAFTAATARDSQESGGGHTRALDDAGLDRLFKAMADRTRRAVLGRLVDAERPVSVEQLHRDLGDDARSAPRDLRTSLIHVHLPMLEANDLVRYDRERGTVLLSATPEAAAFRTLSRTVPASGPDR